jgi:hypothetical protein
MPSYKGLYRVKRPDKYLGDPTRVVFRSLLETRLFKFCEENDAVVKWASEEMFVGYISPLDSRPHRYFPDVIMQVRQSDNTIKTFMVEIKPDSQTRPPAAIKTKSAKRRKRLLLETAVYAVNQAKWQAADAFCKTRGWTFMICTEKDLYAGLKV